MIELLWQPSTLTHQEIIIEITNVISWFLGYVKENEPLILCNGYLVVKEPVNKFSVLLLLGDDIALHKKALTILQQPPNEFVGKYSPCILYDEPESVKEVKMEDDKEDEKG